MRITDISAASLRQSVRKGAISFKFGEMHWIESLLIRLSAENGTQGYGVIEATPPLGLPSAAVPPVLGVFRDAIIGAEIGHHREILTNLKHRLFDLNYSFNPILAAIDCALHDLAARVAGQPLCQYLGGPSDGHVRTLDVIPHATTSETEADVRHSLSGGVTAVKLKLTGYSPSDIKRVRHVRETFGSDLEILCDANGAYTEKTVQQVFQPLSDLGVLILEQPLPGPDTKGMAALTKMSLLPIEADESVCSAKDARAAIAGRLSNVISFRVSRFGSIQETFSIAHLCTQNGISFRFGAMFTPCLQNALTAHIALALPPQKYPHELSMHALFLDDPFQGFHQQNGHVVIDPKQPGSGLTLTPDSIEFSPITG